MELRESPSQRLFFLLQYFRCWIIQDCGAETLCSLERRMAIGNWLRCRISKTCGFTVQIPMSRKLICAEEALTLMRSGDMRWRASNNISKELEDPTEKWRQSNVMECHDRFPFILLIVVVFAQRGRVVFFFLLYISVPSGCPHLKHARVIRQGGATKTTSSSAQLNGGRIPFVIEYRTLIPQRLTSRTDDLR